MFVTVTGQTPDHQHGVRRSIGRKSGGFGVAAGQWVRGSVRTDEAGQFAHGLGRGFEIAAQVLGLAVTRFGHQFEQARAGFAEVCQAGVPEFVQVPSGSGPVGGGGGVEEIAGLVVGQRASPVSGQVSRSARYFPGPGRRWVTNTGPRLRPRSNRGSSRAVPASQ